MVFDNISILKGVLVDKEGFYEFITFLNNKFKKKFSINELESFANEDNYFDFYDIIFEDINPFLKRFKIEIFKLKVCCSDISWDTFVIGKCIKTYNRVSAI